MQALQKPANPRRRVKQQFFGLRGYMSHSLELIVDGYIRLRDRDALEGLLAHRRQLLRQLVSVTGIDPGHTIAQVNQEITVIEAALATLAPE
ncbi:hypothetical protein QA640_22905 [Bradyrhizobium sp. CB82]|uniref:hypothetical protein n=1 Tax=Bradyrhizobium sp. CB82 TaxID=3039159 RepID=UPI0024B05C0F|nr:hypothetical protein [Bradyrhizobium sp. CB82]WFU37344.1 hypothetical protein QA640_22905 [Bradyrhizobium sp. CB82]